MAKRERSIRTEGVILRRRNFGESDRILVLFTRKLGRISVIAKGSRKPSSKLSGHLEPFMRSSFLISRGRNLHIVTQAESIADYEELRQDLKGVGRGSYIIELIDAVTYEEGSNLKLYELLVDTLELLNKGQDPGIVMRYFELETLSLVGFQPELFSCVECGKVIVEQDQFLSGEMGGVVCPDCARGLTQSRLRAITSRNLKYLRHFQRSKIRDILQLMIPAEVKEDLEKSLQYYFAHTLERHLNSPEFIKLIENNQ